jgi:hypothetical protein
VIVEVPCNGCGRVQRLRQNKVVVCDGYLCGGSRCKQNPNFVLPAIPEGCVRHIIYNVAGSFSGYNTRFATPEEVAAVNRARSTLKRGQEQACK